MAYDGPRFRRDLISTVFYEGGVRCVDVHDPKRGATFRLFDYEYSVALAFDGRDLGKVISWVRVSTGLELNEEQLTAFAKRLDQLGFLEKPKSEGVVTPPPVSPRETPAPLPLPPEPAPPPPRDENAPTPEAGSLATATRSTSGERMASTGAERPDMTESGAAEAPEAEPEPQPTAEAPPQPADEAPPQPTDEAPPQPAVEAQPPSADETPPKPTDETPPKPAVEAQPPPADETPPQPTDEPSTQPAVEAPPQPALEIPPPPAVETMTDVVDAPAQPPAEVTVPEESAASPDEAPNAPATQASEDLASPAEPALAESAPVAEEPKSAPRHTADEDVPTPAPTKEAPTPAPVKAEEPEAENAAPPTPAPSSSEPELPVAVGPSPERPREREAPRTARLPADARERTAGPTARRQVTPPPIPRGHYTPTPVPVTGARRGAWMLSAFFGILAAMVVGAVLAPFALGTRPPAPVPVRVKLAKPTEVVRWYDVTAPVETPPLLTLSFPVGGKVLRMASPGLELRPGDVVAATDAARLALADWSRAQEQLAFAKQLVEGLRDSGDEQKTAAAQTTVAHRMLQEERALAAVSKVAITAQEPSTVEQTLASLGQMVQAGATAVRLRLPGWRVRFDMSRLPGSQVRKLGLCLVEVAGRQVSCSFVPDESDDNHLVVSLPADAVPTAGLLTHLARIRVREAYVLPASAVSNSNGRPRVLVVTPDGRAEMRSVVLADRTQDQAVVTQGLDPGDAVVVHASQPVGAGTPVRIEHTFSD